LTIPVIGNGDIFSVEIAKKRLQKTSCQGIMLARGIQGNPWLARRIIKYLETNQLQNPPSDDKIIEMARYHLQQAISYYGETRGIPKMRKHLSWYLKGMSNSTKIKDKINHAQTMTMLNEILDDYKESLY
jgi:tRNA-dihydrouridine synthase B